MKLGIVHQRIRPSSPQENGQHERMHKDLKAETTRPPAENLRKQQAAIPTATGVCWRGADRISSRAPVARLPGRGAGEPWTPPKCPGKARIFAWDEDLEGLVRSVTRGRSSSEARSPVAGMPPQLAIRA
jgi:hypothetical protein